MRTLVIFTAALCLAPFGATAEFNPYEGAKPLAVFIQTDPWAMVIGSDTPRVAIYENGEVIFLRKVNDRWALFHVTLDKPALEKVRKQLKPFLGLKKLKPFYDVAPNVTDQPQAIFWVRDGDREAATSVYGLMAEGTQLPAYTTMHGEVTPDVPPDELLKLHRWLSKLDYDGAQEWTPKYIEVMLWDFSRATGSERWPKEWPGLSSERAIRRGQSYSIFLDGALLPKLRELLASLDMRDALEVDGKKMSVSYRFVFPSEPVWRKGLAAAAQKAVETSN
jgi:hypothetical protein